MPKGTTDSFVASLPRGDSDASEPVRASGDTALSGDAPPSGETVDLPVAPGDIVDERYVIDRLLGAGGMGVVFLAHHVDLGQSVAIKFLRSQMLAKDNLVARFLDEARAAAALRSEHVVRVMDVGQLPSGIPYFVMEHLDGTDLHALLLRDGPFEASAAVEYVLQACEALREVHAAGIVHRDVKPENLVLAAVGSRSIIKVVDFGIAKQLDSSRRVITDAGEQMGSPSYMSPEQMCTTHAVDQRSDIWSLGVVLYQLMTGHLPFDGGTIMEIFARVLNAPTPSPSSLREGVDPALEAIIHKCLAKEPDERYADVDALVVALMAWRDAHPTEDVRRTGEPSAVSVSVPAPAAALHPRPHRYGLAALVGAAAIAAGFMGAYGADRSGLVDRAREWGAIGGRGVIARSWSAGHALGTDLVARVRGQADGRLVLNALETDASPVPPEAGSDGYFVDPLGFVSVDPTAEFVTAERETEVIDASTLDDALEPAREARERRQKRVREDQEETATQGREPYDEYLARHGWRPLNDVLKEESAKHRPAAPPQEATTPESATPEPSKPELAAPEIATPPEPSAPELKAPPEAAPQEPAKTDLAAPESSPPEHAASPEPTPSEGQPADEKADGSLKPP